MISERARALADALLARDGKPAFSPFTDGIETIDPDLRKKAEDTAESIAQAVVPAFVSLAKATKTTGAVVTVDGGNIAAALR